MIDQDLNHMRPGTVTQIICLPRTFCQREIVKEHSCQEQLTDLTEGSIDVAIVKEFYANLYIPDDKFPKQVRVQGHLIKFDVDSLNTFLENLVVVEQGECLPSYSRFARLRPDPQVLHMGQIFCKSLLSHGSPNFF